MVEFGTFHWTRPRWPRAGARVTAGCLIYALALFGPALVRAQSPELLRSYQTFEESKAANDLPAALRYGHRALQLSESEPDPDGHDLIDLLRSLAEVSARAGNDAEALRLYRRALQLQESELGADHPDLVAVLTALVDLQLKDQQYAEAEALLQRILDIERAAYGPRHENVIATLHKLRELYRITANTEALARTDEQIERAEVAARGLNNPAEVSENERRYKLNHGFATVRVFYGTNRAPTGELKPAQFYGRARGDLQYGYLDVTIPETHKEAELETQPRWSVYTYVMSEDTLRRHFVLLEKITPLARDGFLGALRQQIKEAPSKDVFIFVHGFNTTFEDAARRTAQLAYDLDFDGTPMMYSWPSQGSTTAYTVDEAAVGISGRKLAAFLEDVAAQSGAERIHLIAHSMGNRALLEALQTYLAKRGSTERQRPFGQIVFTAPDVDRDYFIDAMDPLRSAAARVTLYASEKDLALRTSQLIHGAPRAGSAGESIIMLPGLDTIDMSAVPADSLGHSYFAANAGAIFDLFRLLWRGDPPPRRCGMSEHSSGASRIVWLFHVHGCEGDDLLEAGVMLKRFGDLARARAVANIAALTDPSQKQQWSLILARLDDLLAPDVPRAAGSKQ